MCFGGKAKKENMLRFNLSEFSNGQSIAAEKGKFRNREWRNAVPYHSRSYAKFSHAHPAPIPFDAPLAESMRLYPDIHTRVSRSPVEMIRMRIPPRTRCSHSQYSTISAITHDIAGGSVTIQGKISYPVLPWEVKRSAGHAFA